MTNNAKITTRNIEVPSNKAERINPKADLQKRAQEISEEISSASSSAGSSTAKPGSLYAKAMMVKEYNEKHAKK